MGSFSKPIAHRPGDDKELVPMPVLLKKIAMYAGLAGPVVAQYVPGHIGLAIGSILTGIGLLAGYNTPTPAATKQFGAGAK